MNLSLNDACNNIFDIAGIRVVCPYIKDIYLIKDRILAQDDIEIMKIKDYIDEYNNKRQKIYENYNSERINNRVERNEPASDKNKRYSRRSSEHRRRYSFERRPS